MIRLFRVSIPSSAVALILSESALIFACYLLAAYLAVKVPLVTFLFDQSGYWQINFETGVIVLGLYFSDLYENFRVRSRIRLLQQFSLAGGSAFLLQSLLARKTSGGRALLFLGSSPAVREIVRTLNETPEIGMSPIGYLDAGPGAGPAPDAPRLGSLDDLDAILAEKHPARVVVGLENPGVLPVEHLLQLR